MVQNKLKTEQKLCWFTMRITATEQLRWHKAAKRAGVPLSQYVRYLVAQAIRSDMLERRKLRKKIKLKKQR